MLKSHWNNDVWHKKRKSWICIPVPGRFKWWKHRHPNTTASLSKTMNRLTVKCLDWPLSLLVWDLFCLFFSLKSCEVPTNMMWNGPISQRPSESGTLSPIPTGRISDFKMLTTEQLMAAARAGELFMGGRGGKGGFNGQCSNIVPLFVLTLPLWPRRDLCSSVDQQTSCEPRP